MKNFAFCILVVSCALNNAFAVDEMMQKVIDNIKPVELSEDRDISILYEMPKKDVNIRLEDVMSGSKLASDSKVKSKQQIIELNPDEIISDAYKAANSNSLEAAVFLYKKALQLDPKSINAMFALGSLYQKLSFNQEAISYYKKILEMEPRHEETVTNYIAIISHDKPDVALEKLKILEKTNPEFSPIHSHLGIIYTKIGEFHAAEQHFQKAIFISPASVNYRYNIAVMYDTANAKELAINAYKQTLNLGFSSLDKGTKHKIQRRMAELQRELAA